MNFLTNKNLNNKRKAFALIIAMIFVAIFSTLAIGLSGMCTTNVQLSENQHLVNNALTAAQSGLECGKYIVSQTMPYLETTGTNYVTAEQANRVWLTLCQKADELGLDGQSVPSPARFSDAGGAGDEVTIPAIDYGSPDNGFTIRFYRYDADPLTIKIESTGIKREVSRTISIDIQVSKDAGVLNYAIAGNGRMWITGDSTIYGDVFSSWDRPEISPFNMTSDSQVFGTINTILKNSQIEAHGYQMETLNEDGKPIDANGDPLTTNYEDRYYGPYDEVQGYHENIKYAPEDEEEYEKYLLATQNMSGMSIDDYDTGVYYDIVMGESGSGNISTSSNIQREYFPHAAGDYTQPQSSSSRRLDRHVYEDQTFANVRLPDNRNALFRNCTFEEILYIDCYKSASSYYNNVRFENCTFNGIIVTDTPQSLKWQANCLYFTGEANFNNQSSIQEATILAPHFNVDLGNTNPEQNDNNVLTGAIVGGIVDVRGNAKINGTIISMCDTTQWSSGYVTNIGATLDDGGSETTELGDIGIIEIEPDKEKMLPSGITSPIVIKTLSETYTEL